MRLLPALAGAACLAFGAPACYAPDIVSGSLACGPQSSCPSGYACNAADQTCWKEGESPATAKLGGKMDSFIGHWNFTKKATIKASCTDGSRDMRTLETDSMDVAEGIAGDVTATYFCDWELNVATNGKSATLADKTTTCPSDVPHRLTKQIITRYTWSANIFTFATTGASNAVVHGALSATFVKNLMCPVCPNDAMTCAACVPCTANCTGTCTAEFTGPLVKVAAAP